MTVEFLNFEKFRQQVSSEQRRSITCVPVMRPFVSLDEYGYLELSQPAGHGDSFVDTNMTCSYQPLLNNTVGKVLLGEDTKIEFNQLTFIKDSQIVVKCHRSSPSKEIVYEKAFVNVPYTSGPAAKPKFKRSDPPTVFTPGVPIDGAARFRPGLAIPLQTKHASNNEISC
uniref:ZP domain-containing protein n=1 Tax=Angiostrongylus cantonensis TaxID=6313 RepID=A0A158P5Y5_ANGCA